jgi:ATP adenylyltransferase
MLPTLRILTWWLPLVAQCPIRRIRPVANQRLWAPWRLSYIKGDKTDECIFCTKPEADDDAGNYIVHRGETCFVILNAFPYTNGHLMVAPFNHRAGVEELDAATLAEMMLLVQRGVRALAEAYRPEGYNIGVNQGKVAGAGVEGHVHMHVVPRWGGDTNFMPVLGDTRVMPQSLEDSYDAVKSHFG